MERVGCELEGGGVGGVDGVGGVWWLDSGHIGRVRGVLGAMVAGRHNLRVEDVNGDAVIIQGGRLQDDASCAQQHRQREDPQEQAVKHHSHVLPVLFHLAGKHWANNSLSLVLQFMMNFHAESGL